MKVKTIEYKYALDNIDTLSPDNNITTLVPYGDSSIYKSKIQTKVEIILKKLVDIIASIIGIIILIPLSIIIYIANFISGDKGPLFYTQNRIGKNGKLFKMYKFRSMVVGADEKLKEYLEQNEDARLEYKKYKKLKNDPRITKIGKFIRKTSIDEFPQFINVLKGDMSLVGPRPYLPAEKEDMNGYYRYITLCKPGITGYWQINGRNGVTFDDRIDMDMKYYHTHNLKLDMKILFKTVKKLIKKEGAI